MSQLVVATPDEALADDNGGIESFCFKETVGAIIDAQNVGTILRSVGTIQRHMHFQGKLQVENGAIMLGAK